jgi:D-alanyl-D-alanine carboxypeptidase
MASEPESTVKLFSYTDDQPRNGRGMLIPRPKAGPHPKHTFTPVSARASRSTRGVSAAHAAITVVAAVLLLGVGATGYGLVSQMNLAAAPVVTIVNPYDQTKTELTYGPQPALTKESLFIDTRDSFIEEELTFIEVDLSKRQLRFFEEGVLVQSAEIFAAGEKGSWWETPSGLYKVEEKNDETFTNIGQVYLPFELTFGGNYVIHGWPVYPDRVPVVTDFVGGGIRLDDKQASKLFKAVAVGTPILIHAATEEKKEVFIYEPQVPELATPHYFIADIDNNTILAATDLHAVAPIASLTKLMTAVVAAEELDLDSRVMAVSPTFVNSLIPRLSGRGSVSMYSLLQLLLVESSNEAAETIAGEMGRDVFIEAMNAKARQLGMLDSQFADPSGLSAENRSSLNDLYILTKYIHENRSFILEITADEKIPSAYVGGEFDGLINFNEVEDMDSFIGGKVGETMAAGQTSISLHQLDFQGKKRTLAVILLGSEHRTDDIKTLITYVEQRFGG